jgi:hypothetical protein
MGFTKSKWRNNQLAFYDGTTFETVRPVAPFYWKDDFFVDAQIKAAGLPGWTLKDSGAATEVQVADLSCGVFSLNLAANVEKEYAGITFNDQLVLDLDKGPIVEFRVAVHTTPTDQAELYFGVINDWVEGPYAEAVAGATVHSLFHFDGALLCEIHTDDTVNETAAGGVTTGITVVEDAFHVYRIDFTNAADVKFYIDGVAVATSSTFNMSQGTNVMVQPIVEAHKEAGNGVGSLYVDYVKLWQATR